nr:hypothetical protein [bacterium]
MLLPWMYPLGVFHAGEHHTNHLESLYPETDDRDIVRAFSQ